MKHGDKAKSKAASKASGKKSSQGSAKSSKVAQVVKGKKHETGGKAAKAGAKAGGNGKTRGPADAGGFTNPVIAAAFKRAVRKYPNAFRKLTD